MSSQIGWKYFSIHTRFIIWSHMSVHFKFTETLINFWVTLFHMYVGSKGKISDPNTCNRTVLVIITENSKGSQGLFEFWSLKILSSIWSVKFSCRNHNFPFYVDLPWSNRKTSLFMESRKVDSITSPMLGPSSNVLLWNLTCTWKNFIWQ